MWGYVSMLGGIVPRLGDTGVCNRGNTMQGHPEVILISRNCCAANWPRDQYFIHSRIYEDLGLARLFARMDHEMRGDAACRCPAASHPVPGRYARHATASLPLAAPCRDAAKDLALGTSACRLQKAWRCASVGDYVGRDLLLAQLRDTEEDHAYWLEKQLGLIEKIGLENYLQSQTGTAP